MLPGPMVKEPLFIAKDRTNLLILAGLVLVPIVVCIGLPMTMGIIGGLVGSMGGR
jgi:hypothetical protein